MVGTDWSNYLGLLRDNHLMRITPNFDFYFNYLCFTVIF